MLEIFTDRESLNVEAADQLVKLANEAVAQNGRFLIALSGGSTPAGLFKLLAQSPYREQMPWANSIVFWSDERLVPPGDDGSNYKQAHDLLLRHVPIPSDQIVRAKGEQSPEAAVADYQAALQQYATDNRPEPRFDLILLGMGSDGHTASLFPGPISQAEEAQPIIAVTADYDGRPAHRISMTPRLINQARHIFFLVAGASKAAALTAVLQGPYQPEQWPAQRISPENGRLHWFVDEPAAEKIDP